MPDIVSSRRCVCRVLPQADNFLFEAVDEEEQHRREEGEDWGTEGDGDGYADEDEEEEEEEVVDLDAL